MLHLYQSNRLEVLLELLLQVTSMPLADALAPERLVVQSKGMGRWLGFELARRQGIAANLQAELPASFVWRLMRSVLGELPARSGYSPEVLVWRVLTWLETQAGAHPRLAAYLAGGDARRRYQLASRIADIFDQYLVYRPDWLSAWENRQELRLGEDESWQAALWRDLSAADGQHRATWFTELINHPRLAESLPERVTLFGISSLPPVYFDLFEKLAEKMDVCLFALNPCAEFWGDVRGKLQLSDGVDPHDLRLQLEGQGNPLLASMGRQGRAFFDRLAGHNEIRDFIDCAPGQDTLLHALQQDIFDCVNRERDQALPLADDDDSLLVAVCHGPQREVEALRDELLRCLAADTTLQPDEIVVLCPDIETYAPYIDAVFARREGEPFIPYAIADRGGRSSEPLFAAFLQLLALPQSRFAAEEIMGLLEVPALRRAFGIEEADLPRLIDWVRQSGIRWGRDAAHRAALGLPSEATHTWRFGLDRLLLGVVLPAAAPQSWQGVAPQAGLQWSDQVLVGNLVHFVETLFGLAEKLARPQSAVQWRETLLAVLDTLFVGEDEELEALAALRTAFGDLAECAELAGFDGQLPTVWLREEITARLDGAGGAGGFLSGGVTFCTLTPMRSLPFRRIAVLGLNDGAFPRATPAAGFDLMARHPRAGDRLRRLDDRYLFLETLLSARDGLYLSYTGRDARDNSVLPPSVLLADLLDVVGRSFTPDVLPRIVRQHRLQAFHPDYFRPSALSQSFSPHALAAASEASGMQEAPPLNVALPPAELPPTVSLDELIQCFANTSRFFLRQRLRLRLPWGREELEEDEPFAVDFRSRETLRLLAAEAGDGVDAYARAAGLLPHGTAGELAAQAEIAAGQRLGAAIAKLAAEPLPPQPFRLELAGVMLSGNLDHLTTAGRIVPVAGKIKPRHLLAAWITHLALNAATPQQAGLRTMLVGVDETQVFEAEPQASSCLLSWILAWKRAWTAPLPFFPKSSAAWAEARQEGKDEDAALKAARKEWQRVEFKREGWEMGESEDRWHACLWRDEEPFGPQFAELAERLWPERAESMA